MKDSRVQLQLVTVLADGECHSEEDLASILQLSQADIKKYMDGLKGWGIEFVAIVGKGYCLEKPLELLDISMIKHATKEYQGEIALIPIIDSTNSYLLDPAIQVKKGDSCITEYQYAGRGRRGREWFSQFGANICFSIFWQFPQSNIIMGGLSLAVGAIVADVLQRMGVSRVKLKWPNDIYVDECKLAGILIESSGKKDDVVRLAIGIGINLFLNKSLAKNITTPWIGLQEASDPISRNQLIIHLIKALHAGLEKFEQQGLEPFLAHWKALDDFIDKPVKLLMGEQVIYGISRGIDAKGSLLLDQEGVINHYMVGEISLRPIN